ncbi:DNA ligase [subsurface metagenome]
MRIEEVTKLKLKKALNIELYDLDLRFSQVWRKYFERPKPKLEVKRGEMLSNYQILIKEMRRRKIHHVETGIDDILFKKEELGIDTPSLGSIIVDPGYISIVRDSKKSLRDQPDINILIRDEQNPKLELALTKLFGKQINKKLNFIYDKTEWESCIPLFEKVLRPKEKIEIARDDTTGTGLIEVLGTMAQLNSPHGKHFSLLIRHKDKRILIDPAVHKKEIKEELDFIIVTQADKDHWEYLNEYKDIPVYTVGAIFDRLPKREGTHLFLKPLKIDGMEITPIKTTPEAGTPSIGLRLDIGEKKISILPEFSFYLGKAQKDLIRGTIWICGVGDYEKDDKDEGKLPFLTLMRLAEELKPKVIYLTNLRKDILRHKEKVDTGLRIWNGRILYDGDILEEKDFEKREKWGLNKPAYRIFDFEDLKNTPKFQGEKVIVEAKFDGMRCRVEKKGKDIIIMSDPEDIKGSPIKTKRLPWQVEELEKMKEDFVGDSEIIMVDKEKNEGLHRTATNALLNGKFDPTEASKKAHIYIFDIVEHEGKNIRDWPLKERKELLSKFKDSEHVHFVRSSTSLQKEALSYIVDLVDLKNAEKARDKILGYAHKGGPYPKHIAEGVMIKLLNTHYEVPQDHGACKWKEKYEIDCLVVGEKEIIREGKKTGNWNYELAVGPIDKEWAEAISKKDKTAVTEFKGKFYNHIGKSDNTKEDVAIGSILRVASEDVNSYETDVPKYAYYKAYVSVVLQPVPEKNVPDKIFVLERLSGFTPRRERLVEKAVKDDVRTSIAEGKIPKEIYKEHAKENEPLPQEFYNDYREGNVFIQTHIRGLEPEEVEEYKKGKMTLAKLFEGHSIHIDDRMSFSGLKRLVQWVITDNNVESYLRMLKGELVETASGVKNVAKSFALVKPSAEEPGKVKKAEEIKEPSISKKGAEILADLQIVKSSYFIAPGEVGSSAYKYAWMGLIWRGKVKSGIGRKDYHEYFYYPDEKLPDKNKELVKGRYVVKAFKRPGGAGNYWQVWKATEGSPADPIEHKDSGYYVLVPAKDIKAIGRERYQYGRKEPVGR